MGAGEKAMSLPHFPHSQTPAKKGSLGEFELIAFTGNGSEMNGDFKGCMETEPHIWRWGEGRNKIREKLRIAAVWYKNVSGMHSMLA